MTWIKPDNVNLAVVTGSIGGLGLNPIPTFDWNYLSALLQPLQVPFFTTACNLLGAFIAFFAILGIWYSNYKWTGYLPINDNGLYSNTGDPYSVTAIVNEESLFDQEKYNKVGPPFYTAGNLVVYGAFLLFTHFILFMNLVCIIKICGMPVHPSGVLRNWKKSTYDGYDDPHSKMMSRFPEVPEWWYLLIVVVSLVLAILCVKVYPAQTPVWGIFFALGINFVF